MFNFFKNIGGLFLCVIFFLSFSMSLFAENYAVIIGVSEQTDETIEMIERCYYDAELISKTLNKESFIVYDFFARSNESDNNFSLKYNNIPTRENIDKLKNDLAKRIDKSDTLLIYFSGHGSKTSENDTHLFLQNSKSSTLEERNKTALKVSDFRKWMKDNIKTENKLLILDTCHAAATRSSWASDAPNFKEIEEDHDGVMTFASSDYEESSSNIVYTENSTTGPDSKKTISLFTFLLNEALKGNADKNIDDIITTKELNEYLFKHQGTLSKSLENKLVAGNNVEHFDLIEEIKIQPLTSSLQDFALHIIGQMNTVSQKNLEFYGFKERSEKENDTKSQNVIRNYKSRCDYKLKKSLNKDVKVIEQTEAKSQMNNNCILNTEIILTNEKTKDQKDIYHLKSTLKFPNGNEVSMMRKCYDDESQNVQTVEELSSNSTDQELPEFWIEVKNEDDTNFVRREFQEIEDAQYIQLEPGEVYRIGYMNLTEKKFGMKVLIDGRSVILKRPNDKTSNENDTEYVVTRGTSTTTKMLAVGHAPNDESTEISVSNENNNESTETSAS
ncbi:MAG: caspase family protein, partial [Planctomycetia bacterium]|nr:caspase family protein [Planctomycetia bacterium]